LYSVVSYILKNQVHSIIVIESQKIENALSLFAVLFVINEGVPLRTYRGDRLMMMMRKKEKKKQANDD